MALKGKDRKKRDEFFRLIEEDQDAPAPTSSIRVPENLRKALRIAQEMGYTATASISDAAIAGIRAELEAAAYRLILDEHYQEFPHARPDTAQIAIALAESRNDPLAEQHETIRRAVEVLQDRDPKHATDPDAVLLFAAGFQAAATA